MNTQIWLGKPVAEQAEKDIRSEAERLGIREKLAVVGFEEPRWAQYANSIAKSAAKYGFETQNITLEKDATAEELESLLESLSEDNSVGGIILQQPLPQKYAKSIYKISPQKDVDGINPLSVAALYLGQPCLKPATPSAVIKLAEFYGVDFCGKNVVIIGRGTAVGKPLALMLLAKNATVTICHTKTKNLSEIARNADILISACGVAGLVTDKFVNENAVVLDVGLSFANGKTCGDVDLDSVSGHCMAATPVPGGIGPVTRACLFENLLEAIKNK